MKDGVLGLLELTCVAGGGYIFNATKHDKGNGDDASNANKPLDRVEHELLWCYAAAGLFESGAAFEGFDTEDGLDGADDGFGEANDSKADEGMNQSLFAGSNFAGVSGSKYIEIATVDDIANDKVGRDGNDVVCNVGCDFLDVRL